MISDETMSPISWVTTIADVLYLRAVFQISFRVGAMNSLAMAFHASSMMICLNGWSARSDSASERIRTSNACMIEKMQIE